MNGIDIKIPTFLEGQPLPEGYYEAPNPYVDPPKPRYNLRAMVNYARSNNKKFTDLTKEEAELFLA